MDQQPDWSTLASELAQFELSEFILHTCVCGIFLLREGHCKLPGRLSLRSSYFQASEIAYLSFCGCHTGGSLRRVLSPAVSHKCVTNEDLRVEKGPWIAIMFGQYDSNSSNDAFGNEKDSERVPRPSGYINGIDSSQMDFVPLVFKTYNFLMGETFKKRKEKAYESVESTDEDDLDLSPILRSADLSLSEAAIGVCGHCVEQAITMQSVMLAFRGHFSVQPSTELEVCYNPESLYGGHLLSAKQWPNSVE
ncbi:hypothetical protein MJG53_008789 [Ovis ammon polii x Ovis aries]|uniref:Uncharacterized protein n=1 Tax=Ovis ammon polii x Ovis aries TaxID=2918886 RepID=A0ACB9UXL0_9CETA|nr:hypothetical protein MJT46_008418 [Ovis ammon polii x Ovis aries]KAI4582238.1 hypothetical protein MJG53_008789 [Ovis ammon polii x Ovis aries]